MSVVQGQAVTFDRYGGELKLSALDIKELKPNQVLIKVFACALNPIDYKRVAGYTKMFITDKLPNAPVCFDVAGIVHQSTSTKFTVGQRVCSRSRESGTMADYCVVGEDVTALLPDEVSFVDAAAIPLAGQTALQALRLCGLKQGDSVLISGGAGGVGSYAVQLAKHVFKANRVVTTCSSSKIDFCKSIGADECLDYTTQTLASLKSNKFDCIFDSVGVAQEICSAKIIKVGGRIVSVASLPEYDTFQRAGLPINPVLRGIFHVISTRLRWTASPGEYMCMMLNPNAEDLQELVAYLQDGRVKSQIDTVFNGLDKATEAFEKIKTNRAKGKVVVCPVQE